MTHSLEDNWDFKKKFTETGAISSSVNPALRVLQPEPTPVIRGPQ